MTLALVTNDEKTMPIMEEIVFIMSVARDYLEIPSESKVFYPARPATTSAKNSRKKGIKSFRLIYLTWLPALPRLRSIL
jgi:hypothetical protein